jgi:transcriptional regulator with XRE-family HTH domain
MDAFGENLRKRARHLGLSDAEVARRAGLSPRRYGFYVTGDREPDLRTLLRIAETLTCTVDHLLKPSPEDARDCPHKKALERIAAACAHLPPDDLLVVEEVAKALERRRQPQNDHL